MQPAAGIATTSPRLPVVIYLVLLWPPAPSYRTLLRPHGSPRARHPSSRAPALHCPCVVYELPSAPIARRTHQRAVAYSTKAGVTPVSPCPHALFMRRACLPLSPLAFVVWPSCPQRPPWPMGQSPSSSSCNGSIHLAPISPPCGCRRLGRGSRGAANRLPMSLLVQCRGEI